MACPTRAFELRLHSAGVCSAAGGLGATVARMAPGAPAVGVQSVDEHDAAGEPIGVIAAGPAEWLPAARVGHMVRSAALDLSAQAGVAMDALAKERLFIVRPESGAAQAELGFAALQAWLDVCGAESESEQNVIAQRASWHADAAAALAAARRYLAGCEGDACALLLCAESWIGPAALQSLDADDQLRSRSSGGVVPGEAAVLLRLACSSSSSGGVALRYAAGEETQDRLDCEAPLGTLVSQATIATVGSPAEGRAPAATAMRDRHASHRVMAREEEFVRRRNWSHLPAAEPEEWIDTGIFGYLGHCMPLLQLAVLAQLDVARWPAIGCARSLWRHTLVCARLSAGDVPVDTSQRPPPRDAALGVVA
ncbi:hypothetical protein BH11PSE9_BH11PSE9_03550 [soil metagenome]